LDPFFSCEHPHFRTTSPGGRHLISLLLVDGDYRSADRLRAAVPGTTPVAIDAVPSAEQALERLQARSYDVIVAEYRIDGMNGLGLLRHIRGEGNDIPFIFFCEDGPETIPLEALNNGADFYLPKQPQAEQRYAELIRVAEKFAGRRKEAEELRRENRIMDAVLRSSPTGICVVQDHTITWANATSSISSDTTVDPWSAWMRISSSPTPKRTHGSTAGSSQSRSPKAGAPSIPG